MSHDGTRVFVANEDAAIASVVDVATGKILDTFPTGEEPGRRGSAGGRARLGDVRGRRHGRGHRPAFTQGRQGGPGWSQTAFGRVPARWFRRRMPSENGATVTVVNTKTLAVLKTIDLGKGMRPMGTAVSPDGKFMFVTTGRSRMLTIIETATDTIGGSIDAGQRPWGLAVSSTARPLPPNGPSDDVSIVDVAGRRVVKTVPVGRGPWGGLRRSAVITRSVSRHNGACLVRSEREIATGCRVSWRRFVYSVPAIAQDTSSQSGSQNTLILSRRRQRRRSR